MVLIDRQTYENILSHEKNTLMSAYQTVAGPLMSDKA